MSSLTTRPLRRVGLVGLGAAAVLGVSVPTAVAAPGVVIPLTPPAVDLGHYPAENFGPFDYAGQFGTFTPVQVRYADTLTVDLPAELDDSGVLAELVFDNDGDGTPEKTYSSAVGATNPLVVAGAGTGTIVITLPVDDGVNGPEAELLLEPLTSNLSAEFTYYDPISYYLEFDGTAPLAQTLSPELLAYSQASAFPDPVTAGSTFSLTLPVGSLLRQLGITDFTGVEVYLEELDSAGNPTSVLPVELAVQAVDASTASVTLPAGTRAGTYGLTIVQPTDSGVSLVTVEITVAAVAPQAEETAQPVVVNAGLRSNTGVTATPTDGDATTVALGAGLLLASGVGALVVVRNRRRTVTEGGQCEA